MSKLLVLQSDFGIVDGAVSAMTGVALSVDDSIRIFDLSHSVSPFNIFEASYRLFQSILYWPSHTVFVSVVDPGVGSDRSSVVALTTSGHIVITPNNGTLSHIKKYVGLQKVYTIDVSKHRRVGATNQSYTFDGRDLYAYIGARLTSGIIQLEDIGPESTKDDVIDLQLPSSLLEGTKVTGSIEIFDDRYGSIWSSILVEDFEKLNVAYGQKVHVRLSHEDKIILDERIVYGRSFNAVNVQELIVYVSSLNRMSIALNQANLRDTYQLDSGIEWKVEISK